MTLAVATAISPHFATLDVVVIGVALAVIFGTGVALSRRATRSTADYFKARGGLPWWLLGISIVATTFAADTPLAISGFVVSGGLAMNWFWWCQVPMVMAGVFFFARLWRRANPMTDLELLDQRYSGREAQGLRGFKAIYLALPYGCLVMGWVNKAMAKILGLAIPTPPPIPGLDTLVLAAVLATPASGGLAPEVRTAIRSGGIDVLAAPHVVETRAKALFGDGQPSSVYTGHGVTADEATPTLVQETMALRQTINEYKLLFLLFLLCMVYTVISGLWGVVVTDFLQFWVAMFGCILLAWKAIEACGGMDGLLESLSVMYEPDKVHGMTSVVPQIVGGTTEDVVRFFVFVLVAWWAVGFTDGGSYHAQRLLAAKDERHAALGYLTFGIANFALRMWPWIFVGLAAAVMFPVGPGDDPEAGFVLVMLEVLGPGWLGLLVAAFFSAYMSTISTQLNLGASYLLNDFYRPFVRRGASERHYVRMGMACTVVMALGGLVVSLALDSIADAWFLLAAMNGGIGVIYILRWYWWRISAWAEIVCLGGLVLLSPLTAFARPTLDLLRSWTGDDALLAAAEPWMRYPFSLLYAMPLAVGAAIVACYLLPPTRRDVLVDFCRRVQPGGPGWRVIEDEIRAGGTPFRANSPLTLANFACWGAAVAAVYAALAGIGWLVIGDLPSAQPLVPARAKGVIALVLSGLAIAQLARILSRPGRGDSPAH